jgi:hypothetical protein
MTRPTPPKLHIPTEKIQIYPFGDELVARTSQERVYEEVHQGIPALAAIADATISMSNRLTKDARNALFYTTPGADASLREVVVEVALQRREEIAVGQPDAAYMLGQKPAKHQDYETADNDMWMMPKPPGAEG